MVSFETDFWVCGLAPFRSHLVALAYIDDDEEPTEGVLVEYVVYCRKYFFLKKNIFFCFDLNEKAKQSKQAARCDQSCVCCRWPT